MDYKKIIWDTIKYIENNSPKSGYIDITNTHWKQYKKEDKIHLRKLLVKNKLVRLGDNAQWSFQLTGEAMVAEESDFQDNGILKIDDSEFRKQRRISFQGVLLGALLGLLLSPLTTKLTELISPKHHSKIVILPKIQVVHDTVYLPKKK
ncbi:MAG TPA: hypothetical protein VGI43_19285 [Mucilaginibacter sp.]|jgi:hypothetical protein